MRSYNFNLYEKENVMITLTNEFTKEMNELKNLMIEKLTTVDTIRYMSADELLLTQKTLDFIDLSMKVMEEQNRTINNIELVVGRLELKLDKLLERED